MHSRDRSGKADAALAVARQALKAALAALDAVDADRSDADSSELVDPTAALPLPRRRVLQACRSGELEARKIGKRWVASREAIDRFLAGQSAPESDRLARWAAGAR